MIPQILRYVLSGALLMILICCAKEAIDPLTDEMRNQIVLLPQDANMMGYMNFEQIKNSSFYDLVMDSLRGEPFHNEEYLDFLEMTGFDFRKDINELYFAAYLDSSGDKPGGLFVAQGRFEENKLINYIKQKDEKNELIEDTYNNQTVYRIEKNKIVFCFVESKTLVGGKEHYVKSWLDKYDQNGKDRMHPLLPHVGKLKYKKGAWFTMTAEPVISRIKESDFGEKLQGLKNVKHGGFSMDFSDHFNFYADCECSDAEKSELLRDAIKGFIATLKLSKSDDRDAIDILNKIDVKQSNAYVIVKFKMTKDEIERLVLKRKAIVGA